MKMRRFDIPCPDVVLLKKHVLLMSFIGEESVPAPKLKDAILDDKNLRSAYDQAIQLVKDLYTRCNLVHADFNQFNFNRLFNSKKRTTTRSIAVSATFKIGSANSFNRIFTLTTKR